MDDLASRKVMRQSVTMRSGIAVVVMRLSRSILSLLSHPFFFSLSCAFFASGPPRLLLRFLYILLMHFFFLLLLSVNHTFCLGANVLMSAHSQWGKI